MLCVRQPCERVARVENPGPILLVHGCRRPILPPITERRDYAEGVSCHNCVDETSEDDKCAFREAAKAY